MRLPVAILLLTLSACLPGRDAPPEDAAAPLGTEALLVREKTACAARGGRFGPVPGGVVQACFVTPADANQPCSRASDCEGQCLARSRTCAPIKPLYGCNEVLMENGQAAERCLN